MIKRLPNATGILSNAAYYLRHKLNDKNDELVFIHIGKCAGSSVKTCLTDSHFVKERFNKISIIHAHKPPIKRKASYIFAVRNPLSRAVSAFNWRYNLVIRQGLQRDRFAGEASALRQYQTLAALAEDLKINDAFNNEAADNFRKIRHLKEDISFYLDPLIYNIRPDQVFGIISQENAEIELRNLLGVWTVPNEKRSTTNPDDASLRLSQAQNSNLMRLLNKDFLTLERLLDIYPGPHPSKSILLEKDYEIYKKMIST